MKKTLLFILVAIAGMSLSAQTIDDYMEIERQALSAEKKAVVAEAMMLSDSESEAFWTLYNEYNNKMYEQNTELYKLIKKFAEKYETLSDEEALALWNSAMNVDTKLISLEKQYFKKFQKILTGKKVLRYFQIESKIENLIRAQMALEIPLVGD